MDNVKHCWPKAWIEAGRKAGLISGADATTGHMFVVGGDCMRESLSQFAAELQAAERERVIDAVQHLDFGRWSKGEIRDCVQLYGA